MTKYDVIYEGLCDRVECGELTLEEAEYLNNVAYEMYNEDTEYNNEEDALYEAVDYLEDVFEEKINEDERQALIDEAESLAKQYSVTSDPSEKKKILKRLNAIKRKVTGEMSLSKKIALGTGVGVAGLTSGALGTKYFLRNYDQGKASGTKFSAYRDKLGNKAAQGAGYEKLKRYETAAKNKSREKSKTILGRLIADVGYKRATK